MDRRSQRNHIRAAREWLGRADDSLAAEKDVQGDLKLMLAKAELAQVRKSHKTCILSSWSTRLAALLVAVGISGFACWWQAGPAAEPAVPVAGGVRQEHGAQPVSGNPEAVQPQLPASPDFAAQAGSGATLATEPAETEPQPAQSVAPAVSEAAAPHEAAQPAPARPVAPQPPDVNKQQLMQSAGKILRQ